MHRVCSRFTLSMWHSYSNDAVNIHPLKLLLLLSMQTSYGLKYSSTMPTLQLVQLLMSGRNTLLRNARFDRLPTRLNKLIHVYPYLSDLFRSAIPHHHILANRIHCRIQCRGEIFGEVERENVHELCTALALYRIGYKLTNVTNQ